MAGPWRIVVGCAQVSLFGFAWLIAPIYQFGNVNLDVAICTLAGWSVMAVAAIVGLANSKQILNRSRRLNPVA